MNMSATLLRSLNKLEHLGNRLPHPALLFFYLCGIILLLSALLAALDIHVRHPVSGETIQVVNLLSQQGLHKILSQTVTNFTHFAPVGTVLVAMMGIGIAEYSGLLAVALGASVLRAPSYLLTFMVVFAGVMSSLAADTGYVVLIPLAAMLFQAAGRNPLVGIAAAFAGVSGGYSANLIIGPLDAILAGISTEAAHLVKPDYTVTAAGNYYFMIASTLLVSVVGTLVTRYWIEPRLSNQTSSDDSVPSELFSISTQDRRGLWAVAGFTLLFILLLLWMLLPQDGLLRDVETGSVLRSPFIHGIVVIIALYAGLAGIVFGRISGRWQHSSECIPAMESSLSTMAGYLVLMFFAAQFVSYFAWSQLGIIAAIKGAEWLQTWQLPSTGLLLMFVVVAAGINLFVGSASAKWALIAPVFVPMLLLTGISPEATQVAFRIGDSTTNIITPLMPYFGVVVAYVQRYDRQAGMGTIMATMLPYSLGLLSSWMVLLLLWLGLDLPLGPGVRTLLDYTVQ